MKSCLISGVILLLSTTPVLASDAVVFSWNPPNDPHIGQKLNAGDSIVVPRGQVAIILLERYEFVTLTGLTTYHVPHSNESGLATAVVTAMQRFGDIIALRSGEQDSLPPDLWSIDPNRSGPHCVLSSSPPPVWAEASTMTKDYEVTHRSRQIVGYVRIERGQSKAAWPANVPFELNESYIFKRLSDSTSVERNFHALRIGLSERETLLTLLNSGCIAQSRVALAKLTNKSIGPDLPHED